MRRLLSTVVALAICSAFALASIASAGNAAKTKVTIVKYPGQAFAGEVKSPKPNKCADGRKVTVYKQQGQNQDPHNDTKIGTAKAGFGEGHYSWTVYPNSTKGKHYARAGKIDGCKADSSPTI